MSVATVEDYWPLYGLRLRTPRLELRLPTEQEVLALADVAAAGIHDPDEQPFVAAWTDRPEPELRWSLMQWHWRCRADWAPASWRLALGVFSGSMILGAQDIAGEEFSVTRELETGSWLGRAHQGQGVGKEMRVAALFLTFEVLGAEEVRSSAFEDNAASAAVSRALGYADDGIEIKAVQGRRRRLQRFRMDRRGWRDGARRYTEVTAEGVEACREYFGLEVGS